MECIAYMEYICLWSASRYCLNSEDLAVNKIGRNPCAPELAFYRIMNKASKMKSMRGDN